MLPFTLLDEILLQPVLKKLLRLDMVLHVADAARLEPLLAGTGGVLSSQLAQSDLVILRNPPKRR